MSTGERVMFDRQWRTGALIGLLAVAGGLVGGAALGVATAEPVGYAVGFVGGFVLVFLATAYYAYA